MKTEKLIAFLQEMKEAIRRLKDDTTYFQDILVGIDRFHIKILEDNKIDIYYDNPISSMAIIIEESNELYVFAMMILYTNLSYRIEKACQRNKNQEMKKELRRWNVKLGRLIRNLTVKNIRIDKEGSEILYCKTYQLINTASKGLHHKIDQIGKITDSIIPEQSNELKPIRKIYEKVSFEGNSITYYDYIAKKFQTVECTNSMFLYAILNIYAKAYVKSILWLKKEDPTEQWCPLTTWQILQSFTRLLNKHFFRF